MIQIGAAQTQLAFPFNQRDPGTATEIFKTLIALRFAHRNKDFEVLSSVQLLRQNRYRELYILVVVIEDQQPNVSPTPTSHCWNNVILDVYSINQAAIAKHRYCGGRRKWVR